MDTKMEDGAESYNLTNNYKSESETEQSKVEPTEEKVDGFEQKVRSQQNEVVEIDISQDEQANGNVSPSRSKQSDSASESDSDDESIPSERKRQSASDSSTSDLFNDSDSEKSDEVLQRRKSPSSSSSTGEDVPKTRTPSPQPEVPTQVPIEPKSEAVAEEVEPPSSPGIFDDADEDETFDLQAFTAHQLPPEKPKIRPDLVAAILGSSTPRPKTSFGSQPVKPPEPEVKEEKEQKKRAPKMVRKVLVNKKEKDAAERLLPQTTDLVGILPKEDCDFLGKNLWIFTLQQLQRALQPPAEPMVIADQPPESKQVKRDLRQEVMKKLESSSLLKDFRPKQDDTPTNHQATVKIKTEPSDDLMDIDKSAPQDSKIDAGPTKMEVDEPNGLRLAAEERIASWQKAIGEWKAAGIKTPDFRTDSFLLSGPLGCLFPKCTMNFLSSVNITTAYDFMCLKKTETGSVVDMYRAWRKKCGLSDIGALALAKHLLGIGARIEVAIRDVPHADNYTRLWMSGPLVVLSGAAKDFSITHCKLYDAIDFVTRRTKEMADDLAEWRQSKGLNTLKGTGKVAMISAWKAIIKEALDVEAEDGRIVEGFDFARAAEAIEASEPVKKERQKKPERKESKKRDREPQPKKESSTEVLLNSPTFLSTLFGNDTISVLSSSGITTAQHLLDADKVNDSALLKAVADMRRVLGASGEELETPACTRQLDKWCSKVKTKLLEAGNDTSGKVESPEKKKRKKQRRIANRELDGRTAQKFAEVSKDPYGSLSASTKIFLRSIGINTAEEFLRTRTTDVANEFIKWREEKKMSVLKGLGAVASVSGWKAQVRKAAKISGKSEVASLTADVKLTSATPAPAVRRSPEKKSKSGVPTIPEVKDSSDQTVLFGLPRKKFAVHGANGINRIYHFELSVRMSSLDKSNSSLYLTYLGSCVWGGKENFKKDDLKRLAFGSGVGCTRVTVLQEANMLPPIESSDPFEMTGSSCGTFELGKYGVQPLPRLDNNEKIKKAIRIFVSGEGSRSTEKKPSSVSDMEARGYNVLEYGENQKDKKYFPLLQNRIEAGQTVELRFSSNYPPLDTHSDTYEDELRRWIHERMPALTIKELGSLLDYLDDQIGASVYPQFSDAWNQSGLSSTSASKALKSRRRMHWLAVRITSQLQKLLQLSETNDAASMPSSALAQFWTVDVSKRCQEHPMWEDQIQSTLCSETLEEILSEFSSYEYAEFSRTRKHWCPLAKKLFGKAVSLFSEFAIRLDCKKLVDDLCALVSTEASRLKNAATETSPDDDGIDPALILKYRLGTTEYSEFLPDRTALETEAERETIDLCDESIDPSQLSGSALTRVVASLCTIVSDVEPVDAEIASSSSLSTKVIMKGVQEMARNKDNIHLKWYVEYQVLAVADVVIRCGLASVPQDVREGGLSDIRVKVREAVRTAVGHPHVDFPDIVGKKPIEALFGSVPPLAQDATNRGGCTPKSSQFFLGIIWPVMRVSGWRMEAGDKASDVLYLPPGNAKGLKARLIKKEAARNRSKLARKANGIGLGCVPKLTKRLMANCSNSMESIERGKLTVSEALIRYKRYYSDKHRSDDPSTKKVVKITNSVESLFEELAPSLFFKDETDRFALPKEGKFSETLGCEFLMRLLLVVPTMLEKSDLSVQQVRDTRGVVRDLMNYLASHHKVLFDESLHLPPEEYEEESDTPSFLESRLKQASARGGGSKDDDQKFDDMKEVILPGDRPDLTDFVEYVMSQVSVCLATHDDMMRKSRRVSVGHPGIVCKHCLGASNEGKYFFASVESLTTAATVVEKHLAKCAAMPNENKLKMARYRAKHPEQRKTMPSGAQGAFFARLWKRFRVVRAAGDLDMDMMLTVSSDLDGTPNGVGNEESDENIEESNGSSSSNRPVEWRDHVKLLEFIKTTSPWSENGLLKEAIERYYMCLEYGGKIYNTNAMPQHFSSEWLLTKIAPPNKL